MKLAADIQSSECFQIRVLSEQEGVGFSHMFNTAPSGQNG